LKKNYLKELRDKKNNKSRDILYDLEKIVSDPKN